MLVETTWSCSAATVTIPNQQTMTLRLFTVLWLGLQLLQMKSAPWQMLSILSFQMQKATSCSACNRAEECKQQQRFLFALMPVGR
jgi:hypothetical protein